MFVIYILRTCCCFGVDIVNVFLIESRFGATEIMMTVIMGKTERREETS